MATPRGPSHFVNASMRKRGWYCGDVRRPMNVLVAALQQRVKVESLLRLDASGGDSRKWPTGQEQQDELGRRLRAIKFYVIAEQWTPDALDGLLESIAQDSEAFLRQVNAWDDMPSIWRSVYEGVDG